MGGVGSNREGLVGALTWAVAAYAVAEDATPGALFRMAGSNH